MLVHVNYNKEYRLARMKGFVSLKLCNLQVLTDIIVQDNRVNLQPQHYSCWYISLNTLINHVMRLLKCVSLQ